MRALLYLETSAYNYTLMQGSFPEECNRQLHAATISKRVSFHDNLFPTKQVCSWVFRDIISLKP